MTAGEEHPKGGHDVGAPTAWQESEKETISVGKGSGYYSGRNSGPNLLPPMESSSHLFSSPSRLSWAEDAKPETGVLGDVFMETVSHVVLALSIYVMLVFVFELQFFVAFDAGFAVAVLWASSMLCGRLMKLIGLPQLLGMLCAGIALKNFGDPVRGLPDSWAAAIRAFGLMNILMRGGLEMDVGAVRRVGLCVVRLTVLPGVIEAFAAASLAVGIFDMPFFLALALGFILAAVSPAVVVGGMFDLQSRGYGVRQGIPSLVVAAASFDDVVAISGFSMFIGLAVGQGNVVWEALHGPINIVAGCLFGCLGAGLLSLTRLWNAGWKRTAMLLILGVTFTFAAKYSHFGGAGALACLVMAALVSQLWAKGFGGRLSCGPDPHYAHEVEQDLCTIWKVVSEPLLFSVIGAALDFRKIDLGTIPKACGLVLGGVVIRVGVAFLATYGAGLTTRERFFIALAWMPKATVQAALGSVPLDMARLSVDKTDDPEKFARYERWGVEILTTAVFSILLTAPIGLVVIQRLGPRWLEQADDVHTVSCGGGMSPVLPVEAIPPPPATDKQGTGSTTDNSREPLGQLEVEEVTEEQPAFTSEVQPRLAT